MSQQPIETTRGYLNDLLAVHRHVLEAIKRHADDKNIQDLPDAVTTLNDTTTILTRNIRHMEARLETMGGPGAAGQIKEAVTTVTGFLTGLFGQVRAETASRMLRDNVTALNFLMTCAEMLDTTAHALGDEHTASVTHNIMHELPPVILRLTDLVPHVVVHDLARQHPELNLSADERTIRETRESWRSASEGRHPASSNGGATNGRSNNYVVA